MAIQDRYAVSLRESRPDERKPSATLSLTAAGVGLWDWQPSDGTMRCCARARAICGLMADEPITFQRFLARVHSEDRDRVAVAFQQALGEGGPCQIECRTMAGDRERWIAIEGRRCSLSGAIPAMAGVVRNITAGKRSALQRELLVQDLSHRISNAFAVMSAVVYLSGRNAATPEELSRALQARISALAKAYEVPPDDNDIDLRCIVERELAPLSGLAPVAVSGEPTWLAPRFAISMTLILHELATNAMKHGALRHADGELSVRWWAQTANRIPCTVLHWKERSSERIAPPARTGLGSLLLSMTARNVDGDICMEYQPDGLAATVVLPCGRAQRSS